MSVKPIHTPFREKEPENRSPRTGGEGGLHRQHMKTRPTTERNPNIAPSRSAPSLNHGPFQDKQRHNPPRKGGRGGSYIRL